MQCITNKINGALDPVFVVGKTYLVKSTETDMDNVPYYVINVNGEDFNRPCRWFRKPIAKSSRLLSSDPVRDVCLLRKAGIPARRTLYGVRVSRELISKAREVLS